MASVVSYDMGTGSSYNPPSPHPNSGRPAMAFLDVGFLQGVGRSIFGVKFDLDAAGIWAFLNRSSAAPIQGTLLRVYAYDGLKENEDRKPVDPSPEQLALSEHCTMRYGRVVKGKGGNRQKGVDTALVSDLIYYGNQRTYDIAHVVTNDTDFLEPIRRVSDMGRLVVAYEFEEADRKLHPTLRQAVDRVITINRDDTATLFNTPRYQLITSCSVGDTAEIKQAVVQFEDETSLRPANGTEDTLFNIRIIGQSTFDFANPPHSAKPEFVIGTNNSVFGLIEVSGGGTQASEFHHRSIDELVAGLMARTEPFRAASNVEDDT